MTDYGTDLACRDDLDPNLATATGRRVLIDALRWRFETPRGALFYDPDYGLDLRAFINDTFSEGDVLTLRQDIAAECVRDRRVESARADVSFNRATRRLRVAVQVVDGAGPFTVVFDVSSAAVQLLTNGVQP